MRVLKKSFRSFCGAGRIRDGRVMARSSKHVSEEISRIPLSKNQNSKSDQKLVHGSTKFKK
jgi:hypothetical protein